MARRYVTQFDPEKIVVVPTDFLVVGSGIAGLFTALKASDYGQVTVLTKQGAADSNTGLAQGGIAVALDEQDSPGLHRTDTLLAGAGLCDPKVVDILVHEGPARVGELIRMGADFDQVEGAIAFTREAAHSHPRIIHASDATGNEIQRTLLKQCQQTDEVQVVENTVLLDILTNRQEQCIGVLTLERESGRLKAFLSRITVLATGGAGQLYSHTTNPLIATGDGVAAAYRAGCQLWDLEFVQFHPTAFAHPGAPGFLISEAVRGEGGILLNAQGERFMSQYHVLEELAPRDVVARAIWQERQKGPVYLDASHLGAEKVQKRFPNISQKCAACGLNMGLEPIPIAPAAHYTMGGIRTDENGRTTMPGLFACGEVACNGVHGANRLASNSLLDGLVFGDRIIRYCLRQWQESQFWNQKDLVRPEDPVCPAQNPGSASTFDSRSLRRKVPERMWEQVGLVREAQGLQQIVQEFWAWEKQIPDRLHQVDQVEAANLLLLGRLVAEAAWRRQESRGAHFRQDYPQTQDPNWKLHLAFENREEKTRLKPLL